MRLRRRTIVLISAAVMLGAAGLMVGAAVLFVDSARGRQFLRSQAQSYLAGRINGSVYVGEISGSLWRDVAVDSILIRDATDSVVVASGPIALRYDLADLLDRRVVLHGVTVTRPFVHLRRDSTADWTYKRLLRKRGGPTAPASGRRFGDVVLLDSILVLDGSFRWTEPWSPPPAVAAADRDSVIAAELARTDADVRAVPWGYVRARHWTGLRAALPAVRVRHPDSAGVHIRVAHLDVDEFDPPFRIRSVEGTIDIAHDTVRLDLPSFRLPGSHGRAAGVLTTKGGLGVAVRVESDTVSLADIAWIYPTLPTTGGGRMNLTISKRPTSDYTAYALTDVDVRSMRSHLRGKMTFGVDDGLVDITDVDLDLAPLDFVLIERFSGEPLPLPWAGTLAGRVQARGGPLDRFVVDAAAIQFADANVAGVVNRFTGRGGLDITQPALTAFQDFALTVDRLEMRTPQAVNADFPPLRGWVRGSVRLDSVWTDVRFRDADFVYVDDTLPPSRFLGAGRVTSTDVDMIYDVAMIADSISFDALRASYPELPFTGLMAGPFTVRGTLAQLWVDGDWRGPAGAARASLLLDALEPGYAASGRIDVVALDPARILRNAAAYEGEISGGMDLALSGDSVANLDGGLKVVLARSRLGDLRAYAGRADLLFDAGRLRVDTVTMESSAFTLRGGGGLGLRSGVTDSVRFTVEVDSLGGLRPLLTTSTDSVVVDSLAGRVAVVGLLRGDVDSLAAQFTLRGRDIVRGLTSARAVTVDAAIDDLRGAAHGRVMVRADTVVTSGITLAAAVADATLHDRDSLSVTVNVESANGPRLASLADVQWDSAATRVLLSSLDLSIDEHQWRLARAARFTNATDGLSVDALELLGPDSARVRFTGQLPQSTGIDAQAVLQHVPLGDLGRLLQTAEPLGGRLDSEVTLRGTRDAPLINFTIVAQQAAFGEARVEDLRVRGAYTDRALQTAIEYRRANQLVAAADATLPVDLALRSVANRRLDAPLRGTIRADSTDLAVLEAFTSAVRSASGRFNADLTINGTWERPRLVGQASIENGAFALPRLGNVRWREVQGDLRFDGDTIHIRRFTVRSGPRPTSEGRIFGWVNVADPQDLGFDVRLQTTQFRAIDKASVATLDVTTALRVAGRESGSDLTGTVSIDAGNVIIPDIYRKNVISLDDPEFYRIVDTTVFANRRLLPTTPTALVENLRIGNVRVNAGPDLWLRSSEANVKLGGGLQVTAGRSQRSSDRGERQLALDGTLLAERGTYRLTLGVLQRTFEVESGTVRFFGDPDNNPTLDIAALYTVRQFDQGDARQDVRVRVVLGGTLLSPTLRLESPDSLRISGADLISYLVTGAPSFEVGGRASDYTSTAANVLVQSLGSALGSRLTGGALDLFEVQTASVGQGLSSGGRTIGSSILSGTRLRGSGQLTDRLYLRIDAGLCQVGQLVGSGTDTFDPVALTDAVGVKVDWRLSDVFTASAGMEPSTSALLCASGASARGFAPTPRQWGFDLFRTWRY